MSEIEPQKIITMTNPGGPADPSLPSLVPAQVGALKLDLGCGSNKREGFFGVDQFKMPGVDLVLNLGQSPWPWDNDSVSEAHCSHFLEHLTQIERIHFMNELYRVLIPGSQVIIITPHWASNRAYGDLTHQWPPVSEMFYYYLNEAWRLANAPHTDRRWNHQGFTCDFTFGAGYTDHPALRDKNEETKLFMRTWYKEACLDMNALLTKPLPPPPPIT